MKGIFGTSRFSKAPAEDFKEPPPKKGLALFFSIYFRNFWKLVKLNLLFILLCIPVVTIPAAFTGMMYVTNNIFQEKLTFIAIDFFKAFKENFAKSLIYGSIWAVAAGAASFSAYLSLRLLDTSPLFFVTLLVSAALLLILLLMNLYAFLLIALIDLPLAKIMQNAFVLGFIGMKRNALALLISGGILLAIVCFFPFTMILVPFWLLSMLSAIAYFGSYSIIDKHIIEPYQAKHGAPPDPAEDIEPIFKE
jgi:uncharacterized membrane protein YesL